MYLILNLIIESGNIMRFIAKLRKLYEIEKLRYKRKGIKNIVMAIVILIAVLNASTAIGQSLWPTQVQNKQIFMLLISFLIHLFFQVIYFLLYLPGYSNTLDFYDEYRINKGVKRPWQSNSEWPSLKKKLFIYLGINYLVIYPLIIFLSSKISGVKVRFDNFPTTTQLGLQLIFISIVQDAGFYWAHRLAHQNSYFYKFHKIHHEYIELFSLVTEYFHPIDYITGVLIPSGIPFILLGSRAHCFTFFFWQMWKMMVSTQGHCGYYFPWSPSRIFFFVSDPSFHDFHHSKNVGNYCGSIYLWDYFNGSSDEYFEAYGISIKQKRHDN